MEIDESQCDGSVMRYQSTNLLQVKRAMILFLEERTWLEAALRRRRTAPRLIFFSAHYYDICDCYIALACVNHLIFPLCLAVTSTSCTASVRVPFLDGVKLNLQFHLRWRFDARCFSDIKLDIMEGYLFREMFRYKTLEVREHVFILHKSIGSAVETLQVSGQ